MMYRRATGNWTVGLLEDAVGKGISIGDDKEQVAAWLNKTDWEFFHFDAEAHEFDQWGGKTLAEHAKVDLRQIGSWSRVTIDNGSDSTGWPKLGLFWPERIEIYFLFDKESKLMKYLFKNIE